MSRENTTTLRTSTRGERLGFSEIVKIRNEVLAMTAAGRHIIRLEGGEPFPPPPDFVKDAIKRSVEENRTRYAPSSGIALLLEAIVAKLARRNAIQTDESRIIVVNGGAHGLFCSFQATLDEGDEALFLAPYWTPIRDLVAFAGGKAVLLSWDDALSEGPAAAIQKRITSKSRVLYLNSPSNPTGNVLGRSDLEAIARLAIERDLVVISDEAYEDLLYDEPHVSIASLPGMAERTLTVFTLSKSYSLTGVRVGYVVAPEPFMTVIRKLVLNTTNGVSAPAQYGALAALSDRSGYLDGMRDEYRLRRDLLLTAVNGAGFKCKPPRGAFYLLPDVTERLGVDSWVAMKALLEATGIASVPGVVFGREGEGRLRMSFSTSLDVLEEASEALRRF